MFGLLLVGYIVLHHKRICTDNIYHNEELNEATSSIDTRTEALVQKGTDRLMDGRTVFVIAHRLSTVRNATKIAVINEGELVELGTHEELMQIENGIYREMFESQSEKYLKGSNNA